LKTGKVVDLDAGIEFPIKVFKWRLNVYQIHWIYKEYIPAHAFTLLVLTKLPIYNFVTNPDMIMGNANGKDGAVISSYKSTLKETCFTAAHELMHTIGIDHCVYYSCLMNWNVTD